MAHGPDKFSLGNILAGQWDGYIDRWADGAKAVGKPILVSLCNEMNGNWFPWSGYYYGGGQTIAGSVPTRYVGPEYFKRAYRYIVDRVRARGAATSPGCSTSTTSANPTPRATRWRSTTRVQPTRIGSD